MNRRTRMVAIDAGEPEGSLSPEASVVANPPQSDEPEPVWEDEDIAPLNRHSWATTIGFVATMVALGGWTALFILANWPRIQAGAPLEQWSAWLRDWAVPVLLIAVIWLIAMRNSRREALRFGQTARLLSEESARLEERLSIVNRELSLAREFISSQARDIESLGRVASERLSEHADRLASLIADNGSRLDSIQTVSAAALENMETLRGHLPVIASSAKDVTNNIGNAGRTANAQIADLIAGFNRLNEFGQASERQVGTMRSAVDDALSEFTRQTEHLGEVIERRFTELAERGADFRTQLEAQEIDALAAIRSRASALTDELEQSRKILDVQESESLTSLRARLTAIRDESSALVRSLREGETNALDAWKIAVVQLEEDLTNAISRVGEVDERAMSSARNRLTELATEAAELDERMIERDRLFASELERRRAEFEQRHAEFIGSIAAQLESLDLQIDERRAAQEQRGRQLVSQSEAVAQQFTILARKLDEVTALGGEAEDRIGQSLSALSANLQASREALKGTDAAIVELTDGSVRLLELIQASVQHSSSDLPQAMGVSEARLAQVEERVAGLKARLAEAEDSGERIVGSIGSGNTQLQLAISQIETLSAEVESGGLRQAESLAAMTASLERVRGESLALAEQAQNQLSLAIQELDRSAREAVADLGTTSASTIKAVAERLGDETATAIDKAIRTRAEEVSGQLEIAAASAASISREAAMQLRDQLAKVSELTSHLEQRVAHARSRAEEQVDNDFARRVALITESLNSNAIDIASVIDTEVTDTAWSAYLKGDRGIFTRRAVRLLDSGEAKAIAHLYEEDRAFRDHVSRYIHDFEAMLRQLLSTRDGHALGVTLLSSDMGKLYVALAQAIERLRN
ncbi:ATPase [Novosphingobium sp.]|uniref:ATPase n=1 Tax=Novosphingobium sp. TaxID=1874826 RepID=UPI0035B200A8